MVLGGLAEVLVGVKAERESLESVAQPLTVISGESQLANQILRKRLEQVSQEQKAS